ncbi:MAG: chitobiase/beta-hexosaminidase C-terminal domain-containing protein [Ruminococcus sp.]|jgi:tetratricopeptide (TPR) repeat protein
MKCSYCGAPVEEGRVFCLNCGEEIQWVPEYNPISSYRSNENVQASENESWNAVKISPHKNHSAVRSREKPKRKKHYFLKTLVCLFVAALVFLGVKWYIDMKNYDSYEYQINMAQTSYRNGKYEEGLSYAQRASVLTDNGEEAGILEAQILLQLGRVDEAEGILLDLIANDPSSKEAYAELVSVYESEEDMDSLTELIADISDEGIKKEYQAYMPVEVKASQPPGTYQDRTTVELYTEGDQMCSIYYSTDGSDPLTKRNIYKTGIDLPEGTTSLRAVAVNEKGIAGEEKNYIYTVELPRPDVPAITPVSGEYTSSTRSQITLTVPEGCTAYYSFDEKPTLESAQYTQPVDMPDGEHTFYAIIVDQNGKESYPGSATYVLKG